MLTTAQKVTPREVEHAVQVAKDIVAGFTEGAQSAPPSSTAATEDDELLPCFHCGIVEARKTFTFCMLDSCRNVFHLPATGCLHGEKVQRVDDVLLFCSTTCAARDTNASSRGRARGRGRGRSARRGEKQKERAASAVLQD